MCRYFSSRWNDSSSPKIWAPNIQGVDSLKTPMRWAIDRNVHLFYQQCTPVWIVELLKCNLGYVYSIWEAPHHSFAPIKDVPYHITVTVAGIKAQNSGTPGSLGKKCNNTDTVRPKFITCDWVARSHISSLLVWLEEISACLLLQWYKWISCIQEVGFYSQFSSGI